MFTATLKYHHQVPDTRGGVEDTRLEAKAKDTKKIWRPRTDPLEAKAKDTGASVLQKKGFQKNFSKNLKKTSSKIFFRQKRPSKNIFQAIST